jgi:hypothetical protein
MRYVEILQVKCRFCGAEPGEFCRPTFMVEPQGEPLYFHFGRLVAREAKTDAAVSDEQFVREHWNDVVIEWGRIEGKRYGMALAEGRPIYLHGWETETEIWSAARASTEERLEKIKQIDEEIGLVGAIESTTAAFIRSMAGHLKQDAAKELPAWKRILARERAVRADLKRGMKRGENDL